MKENHNFSILFCCLICVFFGLAGLSVLIATHFADLEKYKNTLSLISTIGSLLSGVAGTIAAIAAYVGVNAWKKQINHGKHLSLVWASMESFRNFQNRNLYWFAMAYGYSISVEVDSTNVDSEKMLFDASLEELSRNFRALDKIVVKNQWQWNNYALTLQTNIYGFHQLFVRNKEKPLRKEDFDKELSKLTEQLNTNTDIIEKELDALESKYQ